MRQVNVLVIDEHSDVCASLARGLAAQPGLNVVGATSNLVFGAELAHLSEPDIIVAGFKRVNGDSVVTCRWLKRMSPRSRLVMLASYLEDGEEKRFQAAGASRCLLSGISAKDLAGEVLRVSRAGHRWLVPAQTRKEAQS